MRMRTVFVITACAALLASRLISSAPADPPGNGATQPNIIFLLTDDQRADTLNCMGHSIVRTPHLDRLAADGILFTQAYVVEPTCMPSRVSYLLGQYERVHRVGFSSSHDLSEEQWATSYPAILRKHGYHVGFIGKLGLERYSFKGSPLEKFDFWRGHDGWARFWAKGSPNLEVYRDSPEDIITPIMGESMERFLDQIPEGRPFCLSVSFSAPHGSVSGSMLPDEAGPTRMARPANSHPALKEHPVYGDLYRDRAIRLPDTYTRRPDAYIPSKVLPQEGRARTYSYDYTAETCREHHVRYYQLIHGVDETVGKLRESLLRRGLAEDTVIIFSSDHGLLLGDYGMGGKALLYDLTTRVPFILFDPKLPPAARGKRLDRFVLSLDVAPTILSYAGIEAPSSMQGRNLRALVADPAGRWRNEIFLENLYVGRSNPLIEAVRTAEWKYVRYLRSPGEVYRDADVDFSRVEPILEQLFDLTEDPSEVSNVVDNRANASILEDLRQRCQKASADLVKMRGEDVRPAAATAKARGLEALAGSTSPLRKGDTLSFFGDSVTMQGDGEKGYIGLLRTAIAGATETRGLGVRLIGHGLNGGRVPTVLQGKSPWGDLGGRMEELLAKDTPTVVVIFLGINDVWHGDKGTSKKDFEAGLGAMLELTAKAKAIPILCTPPGIGERPHGENSLDGKLDEYCRIIRTLARERKVALCDLRVAFGEYIAENKKDDTDRGLLTYDGVHMVEAGNRLIADETAETIAAALADRLSDK